MTWDLGLQGLGTLFLMALGFGVFAQMLFLERALWWVGIVAGVAFFVAGLFMSEVVFGWATADDLQPNIDGLSFDEVLALYAIGIPLLLIIRFLARERVASLHHAHG